MMRLKVIGSGSSGNTYLLSTDTETLVLDAGMPSKDTKIALDFNVSRIAGVLVTHIHNDHSKYAHEYEKLGIPVWKPYEDTEHKILTKKFKTFEVTCFDVEHDGTECRAFLIKVDGQTILYATDFEYIKYVFAPKIEINHMIIEANYSKEFISDSAENREHVFRGHSELQTTINFIKANKTNSLCSIVLCHLSNKNAEPIHFINEVQKVSKCVTCVAYKGLELELTDCPF